MTVVLAGRGKSLCHMYDVQAPVFRIGDTCLQNTTLLWLMKWIDFLCLKSNAHTASYCYKLKVTECLSCPGLKSLLGKTASPVWNGPCTFWAVCCHVKHHIQDSLLDTFEVHGLNQLISLNGVPTLKFCNTFWAITVVITSPPLPVCDSKQSGLFWQFEILS